MDILEKKKRIFPVIFVESNTIFPQWSVNEAGTNQSKRKKFYAINVTSNAETLSLSWQLNNMILSNLYFFSVATAIFN